MAKGNQQFQTIRTEGALLPPDILRRIVSRKVDGASPDAYHLPPGNKLNEAISQSWSSLLNHWQVFQATREKLPDSDETGTAVTNERWLLPLFKELDFGRLVTTKSPEIDERVYPIERLYNHTPIHLIGYKLPLDRRTKGARGAATASPHSMVQEFLNRSEGHLWAFLSNGLQLRILRDNVSLSRQAFVEFDLEAMMDGEVYADFALLWMLCHQSRVESDKAADCWLEKWSKLARDQGTRVLNDLRVGVKKSIEALGRGFIGHPRNDNLREKLRTGSLTTDEFYRQLLRTVYRLLFLFVAEDRELLHPPEASAEACDLYDTHYSTHRLRELAHKIRGSKHADLWHSLSLVFDALGTNEGCLQLGLSGLGSFLWRANSTADLLGPQQANGEAVFITNDDLLQAVRVLAFVEQDRVLRIVDYRNLGSEELGSVYESLLELHPVMNVEAKAFELSTATGNERKTTGSYYTPDSLVQCLLDSALNPVVEERLKKKKGEEAEQAILELKVCDPACGSGHFLIAAAHRLARHLARIRTGETEPSPEDYQHSLRDVIGRCVYGVDLNPMAVELCKVNLWMEAIEPGKPLSFLDHHIQCGNSLLGTTPRLIKEGLPDDAFNAIEGDDKEICNKLKKQNADERKDEERGQSRFRFELPLNNAADLPQLIDNIISVNDDSVDKVRSKEELFRVFKAGQTFRDAEFLANARCAAFVWKKDTEPMGIECPTQSTLREFARSMHQAKPMVRDEVNYLSKQFQFFHWNLAFPDVFRLPTADTTAENEEAGWNGGFDILLGNPPWEKINLKDAEYFAVSHPEIAAARTKSKRKSMIQDLKVTDSDNFLAYMNEQRLHDAMSAFFRFSGVFPLTGVSRINLYSLFAESAARNVAPTGRLGLVIASGIVTDENNKDLFAGLVRAGRLVCVWDFENGDIFPDVDSRYKFCIFCAKGIDNSTGDASFAFFLSNPTELHDEGRKFSLTISDLEALSPISKTCPTFRNKREANITKHIYRRTPAWTNHEQCEIWPGVPKTPFNMSNDSDCFITSGSEEFSNDRSLLPVYESKFIHQFNHRFAAADADRDDQVAYITTEQLTDPNYFVEGRYYMPKRILRERYPGRWFVVYRMIARATDERTTIAAVIPGRPTVNSVSIITFVDASTALLVTGEINSFVHDYCSRQKVAGTNFNHWIWHQLPQTRLSQLEETCQWGVELSFRQSIQTRVLELTYTAWDLETFALDCVYQGPPFRWDEKRRFLLRCELDATYFHLYLGLPSEWGTDSPDLREMFPTPRDAVDYIMETFPIVKRKDIARTEVKNDSGEVIEEGRYSTKETILEIYDEMAEAIRTGQPYQTRLDPPPGPPTDPEGNFIPMVQCAPNNWPSHIHPARTAKVKEVR